MRLDKVYNGNIYIYVYVYNMYIYISYIYMYNGKIVYRWGDRGSLMGIQLSKLIHDSMGKSHVPQGNNP